MANSKNSDKIYLKIALVALLIAAGFICLAVFMRSGSVLPTADAPETAVEESPLIEVPAAADTDQDTSAQATTGPAADTILQNVPVLEPEVQLAPPSPRFDVVRVEDDGSALVAGQADVLGRVRLLLDGQIVDKAEAQVNAQGTFVIFAQLPPRPLPQRLELELIADGFDQTTLSDEKVYLTPRKAQDTHTPEEPIAPTVLLADDDGVRVLAPDLPPNAAVALDTISYDPAGEVQLGGRAASGSFVRVYLDDKPITTSRIKNGGQWSTDLPNVETGVYTLRVDELDADGSVTSRVETPFKREEPQGLAQEFQMQTDFNYKVKTVQPGATLWEIAEERYGDGSQYIKVFEANKDRISDPNLIFPGQVFDVPE